jgi:hypothetical protein
MIGATFKNAIVAFEVECQLAQSNLENTIANATSSLEFPSRRDFVARSDIEDLHADVRDAIEAGLKDHRWLTTRAWRALKRALRETAES